MRRDLVGRATGDPQELLGGLHPVGGQVDLPAAHLGEPLGLVEQAPAALELATGTPRPVELEVGAHPGHQLAGGERLDQVVVGAGVEPLEGAFLAGARRQHHHRHPDRQRVRLERLEQPEAVERGIITSVRTRSGASSRASASPSSPVHGGVHGVVLVEQAGDVLADVGVVVDDQDPRTVDVRRRRPVGGRPGCRVRREPPHRLGQEARGRRGHGADGPRAASATWSGGQVVTAEGDPHRERGAHAEHAARRDVAAVQRGPARRPAPARCRTPRGCGTAAPRDPVEPLEQVRQLRRGMPVPVSATLSSRPAALAATDAP